MRQGLSLGLGLPSSLGLLASAPRLHLSLPPQGRRGARSSAAQPTFPCQLRDSNSGPPACVAGKCLFSISSAYGHAVQGCTWVSKKGSRQTIARNNVLIVALFRRSGALEFGRAGVRGTAGRLGCSGLSCGVVSPIPCTRTAHFILGWGYLTSAMEPSLWI